VYELNKENSFSYGLNSKNGVAAFGMIPNNQKVTVTGWLREKTFPRPLMDRSELKK
jgi:hypothetical protein